MAGGDDGPVVVPGKSAESRLIRYVAGLDEDNAMPPEGPATRSRPSRSACSAPGSTRGRSGPDAAVGPRRDAADHWSFQPPERPPLPAVKRAAGRAIRSTASSSPGSRRKGSSPSPEADRPTLIRRLSLDLIGLPPTPDEVDAFVADTAPDAYERLVDRLLASPALRRALGPALARPRPLRRHQRLREGPPSARSGRTATGSSTPSTATCRSTSSPSSSSPATCCPTPTLDQQIATGFHRNTMINEEGGIDVEEFRVDADRRPRRHHRHRLARPDARLRPVPRPQVRPDHAARVLPALRLLQQRRRARDRASPTRPSPRGGPRSRPRSPALEADLPSQYPPEGPEA